MLFESQLERQLGGWRVGWGLRDTGHGVEASVRRRTARRVEAVYATCGRSHRRYENEQGPGVGEKDVMLIQSRRCARALFATLLSSRRRHFNPDVTVRSRLSSERESFAAWKTPSSISLLLLWYFRMTRTRQTMTSPSIRARNQPNGFRDTSDRPTQQSKSTTPSTPAKIVALSSVNNPTSHTHDFFT